MTKSPINRLFSDDFVWSVALGVFLAVFSLPSDSSFAYSGQDFIDQLQGKFKTTSSIYLEARSKQLTYTDTSGGTLTVKDTASVTLAYAYPRQFLQKIVGNARRRQNVIVKNDSMIISYPHLDFNRQYALKKGQIRGLIREHIPVAGALMGVSSGAVEGDSISAEVRDGNVYVTIRNRREQFPFEFVKGKFDRKTLRPYYLVLKGRRNFRLDIVKYVEEERFPRWVEKAFATLDVKWMEETA